MGRFNIAMEEMQANGTLARWLATRPRFRAQEWSALVESVHDQAYSRVVGQYSNELEVGRIPHFTGDRVADEGVSIIRNIRMKWRGRSRTRRTRMGSCVISEWGNAVGFFWLMICTRFMSKVIDQSNLGPESVLCVIHHPAWSGIAC